MGIRSLVLKYPLVSALVVLSSSSLLGCGDDSSPTPDPVIEDSGTDAATAATSARPTATTAPSTPVDEPDTGAADAAPDADPIETSEPSATPDSGGPDSAVSATPSADASASALPDGGPVADGSVPHDGGAGDAGGDAGPACYSSDADPGDNPCADFDECADGGTSDTMLGDACDFYFYSYSGEAFREGLEAFSALALDSCGDNVGQLHEAMAAAGAQVCRVEVAGCVAFAGTCNELTAGECNDVLSPLVPSWRDTVLESGGYFDCFAIAGDPGCGATFKSCAVGYVY